MVTGHGIGAWYPGAASRVDLSGDDIVEECDHLASVVIDAGIVVAEFANRRQMRFQ